MFVPGMLTVFDQREAVKGSTEHSSGLQRVRYQPLASRRTGAGLSVWGRVGVEVGFGTEQQVSLDSCSVFIVLFIDG